MSGRLPDINCNYSGLRAFRSDEYMPKRQVSKLNLLPIRTTLSCFGLSYF